MTTIAQAYIHAETSPSNAELERWWVLAQEVAYQKAQAVYENGVEIELSFEAGSLISRITVVMGACLSVYGAIAIYPDFKAGLAEMVKDAKEFAGSFNEEFLSETNIRDSEIISRQRRSKTPGKILRSIERLERYEQQGLKAPGEFQAILEQLNRAINDLDPHERQNVMKLLKGRFPVLPWSPTLNAGGYVAIRPEDENEYYQMMQREAFDRGFLTRLDTHRPLKAQLKLTWKGE